MFKKKMLDFFRAQKKAKINNLVRNNLKKEKKNIDEIFSKSNQCHFLHNRQH